MDVDSPHSGLEGEPRASIPNRHVLRKIGTVVLAVGLAMLAYGAVAFWLINALPPNGGANGRLPSLYVMGIGIAVAIVGLIARGLRFGGKDDRNGQELRKGIPASYGILLLIAIIILLVFVISRL
jgi:hypothetical protein